MSCKFPRPDPNLSLSSIEVEILARWDRERTFQTSVEQRRAQGATPYIFYDGPPFANGHPHYGHILTSYVKDTIPRYFTMQGKLVERRWGWDCHGLPVELDAQRRLGLGGVKEINEFGVGAFCETCRESVFTYADEWRKVIDRIGRWVDWDDQYRTMDLSYMETVMHIFATLYKEGLIYESYKVLAYCTSCSTPLSNFETRLDDAYRDRTDQSVTVRLPLIDDPATSILVWTTTPWTLPSNVLAAISSTLAYETWQDQAGGTKVVLAAASSDAYAAQLNGWKHISTDPGERWVGRAYMPVFDYFANTQGAFRIVASDIVSEGEGTGVVHIAPAFGEDDAKIGQAHDVVGPQPVCDDGTFDERVRDFAGLHVFDANPKIAQAIDASGRLFATEPYEHAYPHCWRCDSPLIYRAIDSWMLAIDKLRYTMQRSNRSVHWIPAHVKSGAMGHGIESAPDWALTRNRFWGSPVPVWRCDRQNVSESARSSDGTEHVASQPVTNASEIFVPASITELEEVSHQQVTDLHRPAIDEIAWPCACGQGTMRRIPDVLDCWFESGSMPFAQNHWMGEPIGELEYPADFIVEYIGQARGWFYTLLVISSALTQQSSFRTCLAHGILLGDDGRKLSKRLKNFPDPDEVISTWGSDALRASLLSSPIVRGGDGAISTTAIRDAHRTFLAPIMNAYTFFATYSASSGYAGPNAEPDAVRPTHPLDRYILAAAECLREDVTTCLDSYDLGRSYDALGRFCERLTNWYIRLSRRRFWEPTEPMDNAQREPFDTLYAVLHRLARITAPLTPFLADWLGTCLDATQSVHLDDWPEPVLAWQDEALLNENDTVNRLVSMARQIRSEAKVPNRQPLGRVLLVGVDSSLIDRYRDVLCAEMNVKDVQLRFHSSDLAAHKIVPNPRVLGPRLGAKVQEVLGAARRGEVELAPDGSVCIAGETLTSGEFSISLVPATEELGVATEDKTVVALDLHITPALELEGQARYVLRRVQDLRRQANLDVSDRIELVITGGALADRLVGTHSNYLEREALAVAVRTSGAHLAHADAFTLADTPITISLERSG